jgi:alpha-amylase/alpha-mannosidase (GH57 family)
VIWLNFLHFYQPSNQQEDILASVVSQCYKPVFEKINKMENIGLTVNITGSLLELFDHYGYKDLIENIKRAVADKKIELTGSCKYHALLPLIPEEEAIRQIKQNEETLRQYLGKDLKFNGFFPPEMAYDPSG